jgi:cobalt-zinc-cadmium efflux system membrane fusion protein
MTRKYWMAAAFLAGMAAGGLLMTLAGRSGKRASAPAEEKGEPGPASRIRMDPAAQRNIGLLFEQAQWKLVRQTIQATGIVAPNESRLAHVRPLARGRIEKVFVRLGDRVRAGQTLLIYDNVELGEVIGQYLSAVAALDRANAEAQVTKRSLERAKTLVDIGALARAELDRRNAEYTNSLASIESQRADVAKVEEKLHRFGLSEEDVAGLNPREGAGSHREASHSRLKAPFDGIVIQYNAAEGETFGPDDVIFAVADLSTAWILADVYEKDVAAIHPGQEASILVDAYPGEVFRGRITNVSAFLDPKTRTAKVRCEVANPDGRLKLEMFATVQLPTPAGRQALMVPSGALQQVGDRTLVFVPAGGDEFEPRYVRTGARSDGWVEIAAGLKEGERVATHGSFFLKSTLLRSEIGGEE